MSESAFSDFPISRFSDFPPSCFFFSEARLFSADPRADLPDVGTDVIRVPDIIFERFLRSGFDLFGGD